MLSSLASRKTVMKSNFTFLQYPLLLQNLQLKPNLFLHKFSYRRIHISKGVRNLRITKNGEDIISPIKNIEDVALIPKTKSNNENIQNTDDIIKSSLTSKEQEILKENKNNEINDLIDKERKQNQSLKQIMQLDDISIDDLLINLQSRIENENIVDVDQIHTPFLEKIKAITDQLGKLKHNKLSTEEDKQMVDFIKNGNLLQDFNPSPFTDLNVKGIIDDLTEDNLFTNDQAKFLAYIIIDILNKNIYTGYKYKYVKEEELEKIALLLDDRIESFKLNKEKQVNHEKLELDLAFEQFIHSISLVKQSSPHLIENELKRESQIDLKNHQNDINDWFEDLNLQLKNTRYLITVHVLGGLQVKVDEYRWFTMRLTVAAMGLMVLLLTLIIWTNSALKKNNEEEVQASVVLKTLENEELDEDNIPSQLKKEDVDVNIPVEQENMKEEVTFDELPHKPLGPQDLKESSVSEIN